MISLSGLLYLTNMFVILGFQVIHQLLFLVGIMKAGECRLAESVIEFYSSRSGEGACGKANNNGLRISKSTSNKRV
jgi:hypothetical protein